MPMITNDTVFDLSGPDLFVIIITVFALRDKGSHARNESLIRHPHVPNNKPQ